MLKPRCGEGGQGHVKIFDEIDFNYWIRKSNSNWIIQRIIGTDDDEFTVGTFGIGRGNLTKDIIILKRNFLELVIQHLLSRSMIKRFIIIH